MFRSCLVSHARAGYLKQRHPDVRAVYMIGEGGLEEELALVGVRCVKEDRRPAPGMVEDEFRVTETDSEVGG